MLWAENVITADLDFRIRKKRRRELCKNLIAQKILFNECGNYVGSEHAGLGHSSFEEMGTFV